MTGTDPATFKWKLAPNQDFSTPEVVLFCSRQDFNGLVKQTHNFIRKHVIDQKWQQRDRLIVISDWEATCFDFNEEKLLKLAAQTDQLKIEHSVLDGGWFGKWDSDNSSLGNWTVDKKKFPQGLDHFSAQVHKIGMKFGLWLKPEMVSTDAEPYNVHPDWVVRHPYKRCSVGHRQCVLGFANPAMVDSIYQQMVKIIEDVQVDCIKWDMNRNITETYSSYLYSISHPQGEIFHRYIQGVYRLHVKLLISFPDLLAEGCASGSGRFDLGTLYYSPQIWPNDDGGAVERLDIASEALSTYSLPTFNSHVSTIPSDQVKRTVGLKFRQNVACFDPLGYKLDLDKLLTEEKNQIKNWIRWRGEDRKLLVSGAFDQLLKLDPSQNTYAWSVSSSNRQTVGFYRKFARPNEALG